VRPVERRTLEPDELVEQDIHRTACLRRQCADAEKHMNPPWIVDGEAPVIRYTRGHSPER
jgi:hypothetical protein